MARLFLSHSSANDAEVLALNQWLSDKGYEEDTFLDVSPDGGLLPGERWQEALKAAADRCEAVLFLISPAWLASRWGQAEFLYAKSLNKRIFGVLVEAVPPGDLPIEMTAEWQLSDLTQREGARVQFDVSTRRGPRCVSFPAAGLALLLRGLQRAGLDAKSFPWPPPNDSARAPFRGLRALEPRDAAVFFGREAAIVRGLDRLRGLRDSSRENTLVILGASGSGKSSFLRAGLWPRLERMNTAFLPLPILRPEREPIHGESGLIATLAAAFETLGGRHARDHSRGRVAAILSKSTDPLGLLLDELISAHGERHLGGGEDGFHPTIVMSIDQAEELFEPEAAQEAERLFALLSQSFDPAREKQARQIVVMTIRSDRYERLQESTQAACLRRELFDLSPIPIAEFKSVVEGPIQRVRQSGRRLDVDHDLTEALIKDAQGADALPLLAFTLEHLYVQYGQEGRLTLAHYDSFGRVKGSIEAAVKQALAYPAAPPAIPADPGVQNALLRAAFIPWLVRLDPNTDTVARRVAAVDDIPEGSRAIIERLVNARLLIGDHRHGVAVFEIAHESLLRQWPQLSAWLEADLENLRTIEGVIAAAQQWARNGRLDQWLDHRAERLANANALAARGDILRRLDVLGLTYLAACRAREEAEQRAREEVIEREEARLAEIKDQQERTAKAQRETERVLTLNEEAQRKARRRLVAGFGGVLVAGAAIIIGMVFVFTLRHQLASRSDQLDHKQVNLLAEVAATQRLSGNLDGALRMAVHDVRLDGLEPRSGVASAARSELSAAYFRTDWRLSFGGHKGAVRSAAFNPDGTRIVTASSDRTARTWDAVTADQLLVLRGHSGAVTSAAYSPDGRTIVTSSMDGTARLWNGETGQEKTDLRMTGHDGPVWSAAFDTAGDRVVTASSDMTARIWNARTGKLLRILRGHEQPVWHAAFSQDGKMVVTASEDGTARIWDAETGLEIGDPLRAHAGGVWTAAFDNTGKRVVTASYDTYSYVFDLGNRDRPQLLAGHEDWVMSASFSSDGTRVVTGSWDGTARVWDPDTGHEIAKLQGHEGGVLTTVFNTDGTKILTASLDGTARLWEATTGTQRVRLTGHQDKVWSAAFSPDGTKVVTASQDNHAFIWNAETGEKIGDLAEHQSWVMYAAFSPDGKRIVTASQDDTARVWDTATGEQLAVMIGHTGGVMMAEFDSTGTRVVTASYDGTARVWDAKNGRQLLVFNQHEFGVLSAAFSPHGNRIVTSGYDERVIIWDSRNGSIITELHGHTAGVWDAHFNPEGTRVVTASEDRTARVWDASNGRELMVLRGHEDWIWSALFSSDGKRIVTGSQDKTARIWDAETGLELGVLREIERGIYFATFSADGTKIVTASEDGTANIWNAATNTMSTTDLLNESCARRLGRLSKLTRDEMRLAGYSDDQPVIDVCAPAR